jgi:AraC family transcriptional regulator
MQIEWKSQNGSPFLSRQSAEWPGIRIHRAQVMPGRLLEHANDFHDVNIAIAGSLTTAKNCASGNCIQMTGSAGSLCITPAGQSISANWEQPLDNMRLSLDPKYVSKVAAENGFSPKVEFVEIYKKSDPLVQNLGLSLLGNADRDSSLAKLYADSLIQTLMLHLLSNYTTARIAISSGNGGLAGYKLRRVKEFIDEHLDDDLGLNDIASVAGLSPYHFTRAFRKSTGKTPLQYLMQHRLERAKELLAQPGLPIVEVGLSTGFKNQSHFTTLFRKYTKFTPKAWRELKLA